jgi:hypothetical protein
MTDEELKALIADLAKQHAKTETAQQRTEAGLQLLQAAQQRTEETLRHATKQLGGLGNKFGSFTEGLAFESMEKILRTRFHADTLARRIKPARGGYAQEYDLIGIRNGPQGEVYCVEIKSELNAEELDKSLKKFADFFNWFPRYRGMKLYGIISAVDVRGALANRVWHAGLYLATASDNNFKLAKPPRDFKPKVFTAKTNSANE